MKVLYYIFLSIHYALFLFAGFFIFKSISLSWKGYSLHDKLTQNERDARDEGKRIYWYPTWLIGGSFLAFLGAAIVNNL
jgi:hypothetical protein